LIAVLLGLVAALCWSLHDLVARAFAEKIGPFRMSVWVLLLGAAILLPVVMWHGTLWHGDRHSLITASLLGVAYAFALGGLLKAFSLAPVSVVGPLTGGYPALVVVWGMLHGLQPTMLQWLAMAAILLGAIIVGRFGPDDGGFAMVAKGKIWVVLLSAAVAFVGFAASVVLGQQATVGLGEIETTFVSRLPAAVLVFAVLRMSEAPRFVTRPIGMWKAVGTMALCDVIAVTSINVSTFYPNKELGAMAISGYGALSVLLAMIFLKEKVSAAQWLGIAMISGGVAALAIS
jgi:drug/metabolite transporter (DMT)-like permease